MKEMEQTINLFQHEQEKKVILFNGTENVSVCYIEILL